jgi:hypothetical protein
LHLALGLEKPKQHCCRTLACGMKPRLPPENGFHPNALILQ